MSRENHRQTTARLLLAVYAVLLLMMSVHVHDGMTVATDDSCYECVHHVPHGGHLSSATSFIDTCVLCQLLSASCVVPLGLVLLLPVCGRPKKYFAVVNDNVQNFVGARLSRAPPVAC